MLSLPQRDLPFILETNDSDTCWVAILLQKHPRKEEVCAYDQVHFQILSLNTLPHINKFLQ